MLYAILVATAVAPGCGNDVGIEPDAGGPPGSPLVTVTSPRANESFYPSQTIQVAWTAADDDSPGLTCDAAALDGTNRIAIMTGAAIVAGQPSTAAWPLASVPPSRSYRIEVACTDQNALTGTGLSATFAISPPAQQVSFATVQAILTRSCTSMACHDSTQSASGLDLTAGRAYAELSGASGDCPATKLVMPGAPDQSYLVHKLQGSGPCFFGSRMPKGTALPLPADEIQQVRDWIATGAPSS